MSEIKTDQDYLESVSRCDELVDHQDACGHCYMQVLMATVARELAVKGNATIAEWDAEVKKRWEEGKYYKLYQEEKKAGRDPEQAFQAKGWEM